MSSIEFKPPQVQSGSVIEREKRRDYKKDVLEPVEDLKQDFEVQTIGEVTYGAKQYPLFLISNQVKNDALPNVFISAGVHGSEPAGVYALLRFLKEHGAKYQGRTNLFVVPCVNPSGFESNTRKNGEQTDINRDFLGDASAQETKLIKETLKNIGRTYSFSFDMHEDSMDDADPDDPTDVGPKEAYLYESSATKEASIGAALIALLEKEGIAFCKAEEIYEQPNEGGVMWTPWHGENMAEDNNTLEDYLQKYSPHTFTVETPAELPLEERVAIQMKMLQTAIELLHGTGN